VRILKAGWVLPISSAPVRDGIVAIEGGRIAWVGPAAAPGRPDGELVDLGPGVLLPGLVNAHCHLELSHLEGRIRARGNFAAWVEELVSVRSVDVDQGAMRRAVSIALQHLVQGGTAAVGDVSNALAHLDLLGASPLSAIVFFELIGWDPHAASRVLEGADDRLQAVGGRHPFANVEIRLAAHAPHSVSADLLRALVARGGPAALHLAESPQEARFLNTGDEAWSAFLAGRGLRHVAFTPPRVSPVRYVDGLGVLGRNGAHLLAVHCVQVDAPDCALLAERGTFVALCPRSNAHLGVGLPPLPALLSAGVRLCLGSDSLASAPSLDVLEDAAFLHRAFPEVPADLLVEMATAGGAAALGFADLGTLAEGQRAALAHAPSVREVEDPHTFLLGGGVSLRRVAA
jgi:aminodeoxyfutalosine deaminase